ncbi:DNA-directed RNA polymerase subunit delta [Brevibacillus humidisoli]|uniref:DNA-directed RNA polymerase subunit delta n=1 Tax=Brevibacillus humidisoli TaxID=2895522 RepID=UPI001E49D0E5|nr:DNA-directed RNA polymerase subunit delta [Brevibacillus humidisoli]UFJ40206.1 DNA-directed RNA polymerase subunit delta [Brevibacillus humidisoli]
MSQLLQHIEPERLNEMAMVDIAFEILKETNHPQNFRDLMKQIAALRNMTEDEMMAMIAQIYTEVNIDGRFVCLGENTWGLKRWYPMETVEETHESGKKKKAAIDDDFDFEEDTEDDLVEEFDEDDDIEILDDEDFDEDDEDLDDEALDEDEELIEDDEEMFEDEDEISDEETNETDEDKDDF